MRRETGFVKVLTAAIGLSAITIMGCDKLHSAEVAGEGSVSTTPYASAETLENLSTQEGSVDWRVARFFALTDMLGFAEENNWQGAELSQYPLVIYHTGTDAARYYEFRVLRNGAEIGAIACAAETSEGEPVQYVMPYSFTLKDENARAVKTGVRRLVDAGYPSRLIGQDTASGRSVDMTTGKEENVNSYPVDVKVKDYLEQATDEELAALGITDRETLQKAIDAQIEAEEANAKLWQQIEEAKEKILSSTDAEVIESYTTCTDTDEGGRVYSIASYVLSNWYSKTTWSRPNVNLKCVPFVGYFITLGGGTNSGYADVPLSNSDTTKKLNLYYAVENKIAADSLSDQIGLGACLWDLDDALRDLTNYKLDWYPGVGFGDTIWDDIDSHLRNRNLPAVSFRCSYNIFGEGHARAIYGTYSETEKLNWYYWFFGWHYAYSTYPKTRWYQMYDNGAEGFDKGFYEKAGQYFQVSWGKVNRK